MDKFSELYLKNMEVYNKISKEPITNTLLDYIRNIQCKYYPEIDIFFYGII